MIIGLVGRARSGKDTAALMMPSYHIRRIAQPVKDSLKSLYGWDNRHIEGPFKEVIDPYVNKSPRQAMIETAERVKRESGQDGNNLVIPDVRFQNEIDAIRRYGGVLVKVVRDDCSAFVCEDHIDQLVTDYTVHNTSLLNLHSQVADVLESVNLEYGPDEQ